ncbi:MAG: hypothetical protein LIO71_01475 [Ruminococcus sp.]|nr:hypothetical protein [Ruminococcus sp.]
MDSINKNQMYAMLISVRLFEHICSLDMYCRNQMLGVLISLVFQTIMILIIFMFKDKVSIFQKIQSNRILAYVYVIYLVFYGGRSLNMLTSIDNVIPKTITGFVCVLLLGATCIYCSKLGYKAICRSSIIITFMVVISFGLLIYGVTYNIDISNALNDNDRYNIFHYAISDFAKNVDLIFLVLLVDTSYSKKQAFKYLGFKLLAIEVLSFIGLCVLGGTSIVFKYPFLDLGAYSQPFGIQRADSLYILISTLVTVLNISLALNISSRLLKDTLGRHKEIVLTIIMIVISYFVNSLDMTIISAIMILILSCIVPAILNLSGDINQQSKEGI